MKYFVIYVQYVLDNTDIKLLNLYVLTFKAHSHRAKVDAKAKKSSVMFVIYSLIFVHCPLILSAFTPMIAWCE